MTNLENQLKLMKGIDFNEVDFSYHALRRMRNRKVSFEQAQQALENPDKVLPSLTQKNHYFVRLKELNILVAIADKIVVKTVWRYSDGHIQSKRRAKLNKQKKRK